jgi:uncharacterized protein (DUF58 family)
VDEGATSTWAPTRAFGRSVLLVGVLVLAGAVLGRLDLIVLAVPFALGTAWALSRRPAGVPVVAVELTTETAAEADEVGVVIRVANPTGSPFDLAVTRLTHSPWVRLVHGDRPFATDLGSEKATEVRLAGPALRWGRQTVGPAQTYAVACDGLLLCEPERSGAGRIRVHPRMPEFRAVETIPRASVLVGVHRSRRPGEDGELAGVRRFSPGDRLRRVDWRVTLRTRELYVAQTLSDRDAEVVILLDVLDEAGVSGGIHGAASVLDTSVRAAAAIAEYYLRQGDRVGLLEFSGHPRHLRAAPGRRQLIMASEWLLSTRATLGAGDPPRFGIDPWLIPGAALVVVLTPMLDPRSAEMVATLARAGRVVVAIDTLGDLVHHAEPLGDWTIVAHGLWRLDRENMIGALREVGVPVTAWVGAGSLDQVLRDSSRMAAAPRVTVR